MFMITLENQSHGFHGDETFFQFTLWRRNNALYRQTVIMVF